MHSINKRCKCISSKIILVAILGVTACACKRQPATRFIQLSPDDSGIIFQNVVEESPSVNIMSYEYTYNGGGVAAADFNNDGRCDLFFTGNTVKNALYLNEGELRFKDVTAEAGVEGRSLWKTGVTAADVNGDGLLDIYVCYSGPDLNQSLSNELYINNGIDEKGIPIFTERAKEYGLDAPGTYSTQASFFDYDRDGDLDMFLINHGNHFYSPFINTNKLRGTRHPQFGNRLYRNNAVVKEGSTLVAGNNFTEVSQEAGIHGGGINFGLGLSISDVNNDGWPDIFVTNDYEEQDFLYLNNKDGRFIESTKTSFGHLSRNGMGTDIADYNNDLLPDLIEVDMWPEDNFRQKLLKGPDDFNRYMLMVDSGFHYQQMRNTLQLNAGTSTDGTPIFCEVGQLAGVSATDWSWAPLFADVDNDGNQDVFVTNGYLRDFTSMDFLKYTVEEARNKAKQEGKELALYELVSKMPSTRTSDYIFRNNGDLTFTNATKEWGLETPNLSFGAAYADLDNDGDLELITNNTNEPATVWLNKSESFASRHFLKIKLKGAALNPFAIGAKVIVYAGMSNQMREQFPTRGFQSCVEPVLHFGLGEFSDNVNVKVIWPDATVSEFEDVKPDQALEVSYGTMNGAEEQKELPEKQFVDVSSVSGITFVHHENDFNDFDREPLIPYQLSKTGPALAKADVNGDSFDDFFVGGASGQSGELYLSDGRGHFKSASSQPWNEKAKGDDTGATFFDVDGDSDSDLFIVRGGNEFPVGSTALDDQLYLNDGKGRFSKAPAQSTVADHANGSCVTAADFDKDGDVDLFVGGRVLPGSFPLTTPGAILRNETDRIKKLVKFTVATNEVNAQLREPGMVTDAVWSDINNDSWPDLIVIGEWMPVRVFENRQGKLEELKNDVLKNSSGLWCRITSVDIDGDRDQDLVLGNAGKNLPWQVSSSEPLTLYYGDFNDDGRVDPVMCYSSNGKQYPVASRDEIFAQVNSLRKKFTAYAQYANATINDVFDKTVLDGAKTLKVQTTESSVLLNLGEGNFELAPLPIEAQVSNGNGIIARDFDRDKNIDLLLAGNYYPYRTQFGRNNASLGVQLIADDHGTFYPLASRHTGFIATGDVRNMIMLKGVGDTEYILLARNNAAMSLISIDQVNKK
jgi:hypothetical protein